MNIKLLILAFVVFVTISSCSKNNDAPPITLTTALDVVNATADTVNLYLNGTRLNNNSNLFPGSSSGYMTVSTFGADVSQNFQLKKAGKPNAFLNVPLKLDSNKLYSLFVTGPSTDLTFTTIDTLYTDTVNSAFVRFVNTSPWSTRLSMSVGDTVKFININFKSSSGFVPIIEGQKIVKVYQEGNPNPIISVGIQLTATRNYTLFTRGVPNGTGNNTLTVGTAINK